MCHAKKFKSEPQNIEQRMKNAEVFKLHHSEFLVRHSTFGFYDSNLAAGKGPHKARR